MSALLLALLIIALLLVAGGVWVAHWIWLLLIVVALVFIFDLVSRRRPPS